MSAEAFHRGVSPLTRIAVGLRVRLMQAYPHAAGAVGSNVDLRADPCRTIDPIARVVWPPAIRAAVITPNLTRIP
jgi:hypothetical protein